MHTPPERTRRLRRVLGLLYWALTGALFGTGLIMLLGLGWILLFLGLVLAIFGAMRVDQHGLWSAVVGFGALPALILLYDVATAPPPCPPGRITLPPGTQLPTGPIYGGPTDTYQAYALQFALIALAGLLLGLVVELRRSRRAAPTSPT